MAIPKTRSNEPENTSNPSDKINMSDMAEDIKSRSATIVSRASERIEDAKNAVADRLDTVAGSIRDKAPEGALSSAASRVADNLESAGEFLHEQSISDLSGTVVQFVRRYPTASILVGFGAGALLGRALKR